MPRVRVATFNISGGVASDTRFYDLIGSARARRMQARARESMEAIAALIVDQRVDVAALQEVDVCYGGRAGFAQHEVLAERLGWHCAFEPSFDYHLGPFANVTTGVATLSRFPIRMRRRITFSQRHLGWRGAIRGGLLGSKRALHTAHDVGGAELHVINAHLTHDSDVQNELEVGILLRLLGSLSPAVLAGDLNTTPRATQGPEMVEPELYAGERGFGLLRRAPCLQMDPRIRDAAAVREVCTYPSSDPSLKLDYVIAHLDAPYRLAPETVLSSPISNHLPTAAEVSW